MAADFPLNFPWSDLSADMPEARVVEALDDDGDGVADEHVWTRVLAAANNRLVIAAGSSAAALAMAPEARAYAVRIFCLDSLYARRGFAGPSNPFGVRAREQEAAAKDAAAQGREEEQDAGLEVVSEPVVVSDFRGNMP